MTLRIGLIGIGTMGRNHTRILTEQVPGAEVALICDPSAENVAQLRAELPGIPLADNGDALIESDKVDAVIVASPDYTHAQYAMACLRAGKPVLCEKPLAETAAQCRDLIAAEKATGRDLLQVGFMRRFDPAYRQLRAALEDQLMGNPYALRCIHRNARAPSFFTGNMAITNAMVHEFDVLRWLLGAEITAVRAAIPDRAGQDPVLASARLSTGQIAEIEVFMNAGYGYDIRTEVLAERGVLEMARPAKLTEGHGGQLRHDQFHDFTERFADAYRVMLTEWVRAIVTSRSLPACAARGIDGLQSVLASEAGVRALTSGHWEAVVLPPAMTFSDQNRNTS
jgi:myo-inositol 2-dehydrogenase / D-chiro-inositol 1-dehydrogenase